MPDPRQGEDAGVFGVGSIGRTAEDARNDRGNAIANKGAVQSRLFDKILLDCGAHRHYVAEMFYRRGNGDGGHDSDGAQVVLRPSERRHCHPGGVRYGGKIHYAED